MLGAADKLSSSIQTVLTSLLDSARLALGLGAARNFITSSNQAGRSGLAQQPSFYQLNFSWPAAWA